MVLKPTSKSKSKSEIAYASLELVTPSSSSSMRRTSTTSGGSLPYPHHNSSGSPVVPSTSTTTTTSPALLVDPPEREPHAFYKSAAVDILAALEGPLQQFTLEVKGALLATGLAASCYLLSWFQAVLVPFFLAIFLMYLVDPLVEVIDVSPKYFLCICTSRGRHARRTSRGCSRAFASLCAVSVVCIFFGLLGYITVLSVHALDVSAYQSGYTDLVLGLERILVRLSVPMNITTTLHDNVEKLARIVLTETMDLFSVLFVTLIYLTYFLCTRTRASDAGGVWSRIDHDLQRFVTLKCFLSLIVALLVTMVYVALNVGLAIVWGILTFLLNWIPNVGAMIASLLPLGIICITPSEMMNPMEKLLAVCLPMCFHAFVGNFLEPRVFGRKLEMDPVLVILSLSIWGLLWGVVGMMLSVPLTAAFKIMLSHLKLWPELVALMEGTYFARYGRHHRHHHHHHHRHPRGYKKQDEEKEELDDALEEEDEEEQLEHGHNVDVDVGVDVDVDVHAYETMPVRSTGA